MSDVVGVSQVLCFSQTRLCSFTWFSLLKSVPGKIALNAKILASPNRSNLVAMHILYPPRTISLYASHYRSAIDKLVRGPGVLERGWDACTQGRCHAARRRWSGIESLMNPPECADTWKQVENVEKSKWKSKGAKCRRGHFTTVFKRMYATIIHLTSWVTEPFQRIYVPCTIRAQSNTFQRWSG